MTKTHSLKFPLSLLLITLTTACTWVKLSPGAEDVGIASVEEVVNCKVLGSTTVSLKSKVAGIKRNRQKVRLELNTLGRNSAVKMNGDTIVADSYIENGQQTFKIYQCNGHEIKE